jgi:glycosyltransferase involved in cell wall biosynthesis
LKILIISHFFPPHNSIASLRPYSWAKYWTKAGHDVTVLTSEKGISSVDLSLDVSAFNVLTYKSMYSKVYNLRNKVKSVEVSGAEKIATKKTSLMKVFLLFLHKKMQKLGVFTWDARLPNFVATGQSNAYAKVYDQNWDIVISTFAPYSSHQVAYRLKKERKVKKWIVDYRDLWTETHLYKGLFPFTLYEEYLEHKINTCADMITTVSQPLADTLIEKYKISNVEVIENGFDFDDLVMLPESKFWSDGKIRIIYTGTIYQGFRDPSPLFSAIQRISKSDNRALLDDLEVLFYGTANEYLSQLISDYDVQAYVKHCGMLKRDQVLHIQRDADILLFLEFESEQTKGILTGKLFEYLASGTFIWVVGLSQDSSVGKIVMDSEQGECFSKNVSHIESHLLKLLTSEPIAKKKVSDMVIENYSREGLAMKMLNRLECY